MTKILKNFQELKICKSRRHLQNNNLSKWNRKNYQRKRNNNRKLWTSFNFWMSSQRRKRRRKKINPNQKIRKSKNSQNKEQVNLKNNRLLSKNNSNLYDFCINISHCIWSFLFIIHILPQFSEISLKLLNSFFLLLWFIHHLQFP